jgi:hypothetical protein
MSRDDAVLLVSRAIAVMQFITAFLEVTYLPERLTSLRHYSAIGSISPGSTYFENLDRVEIGFLFGRIACLLLTSWLFWSCGPRIGRLLLPPKKTDTVSNQFD